jgi:indole-3-glycerol phosphate synthase/phosphoribosylanthranilate isomerase
MNILEKIVAARRRSFRLYRFPPRRTPLVPFFKAKPFIIAEFKRSSPTQKKISVCPHEKLAQDYYSAGVRNFSVLTEQNYFQGSLPDLYELKQKYPRCAFLRKDFLFCPEDIEQAYQAGADAVLLIAEILNDKMLQTLINTAHKFGLQVLCEAYNLKSLQRILRLKNLPDAVGINSRDLKTFKIQPEQPLRLKPYIPPHIPVVYESGVDNEYILQLIGNAGFRAALIGEAAVKAKARVKTLKGFAQALQNGAGQKPNFFTKLYARKKNIYVKMCGLTNKADVAAAAKAGADVAGFVFVPGSPRGADEKLLREVKNIKILKTAVVKKITPKIKKLLQTGLLDAVQTYNKEDVNQSAGHAYLVSTDMRQ